VKDAPEDLLRCCYRVCGCDVSRAYSRALETFEWRKREGVDDILHSSADLAEELQWRPLLRYGLPGLDRKSRPVMIQAVGRWDMQALNSAMRGKKRELLRSHMVVYETMRKQALEAAPDNWTLGGGFIEDGLCAEAFPKGGSQERRRWRPARWVIVLDMEGLSFWHTRYPEVLASLKEVSAMSAKYYPESIDRMFVVNASPGFHVIWQFISRFVKPNTRAKVRVLPEGDFSSLLKECGPDCIPVQYGGCLPTSSIPYISS